MMITREGIGHGLREEDVQKIDIECDAELLAEVLKKEEQFGSY